MQQQQDSIELTSDRLQRLLHILNSSSSSLSRNMATRGLPDEHLDVFKTICTYADHATILSLCSVSPHWRKVAQAHLFRTVRIELPDLGAPSKTRGLALRTKLQSLAQAIMSRPELGEVMREFHFVDEQFSETFLGLRAVLLGAPNLVTFGFAPKQGQRVNAGIKNYRDLFQRAKFRRFILVSLSFHHLGCIPARHLERLDIWDLRRAEHYLYGPVYSDVALSDIKIDTAALSVVGFDEHAPMGIGTSMTRLSRFFESSLVNCQLRFFRLDSTLITRTTLTSVLSTAGAQLEHLWLAPRIPAPARDAQDGGIRVEPGRGIIVDVQKGLMNAWPGLHPEHEQVLGGASIDWASWTPKLKQITTSVFFPSLAQCKSLHMLSVVWSPEASAVSSLESLIDLLENDTFSPGLKTLRHLQHLYHPFINAGMSLAIQERTTRRLVELVKKRKLIVQPDNYLQKVQSLLKGRALRAECVRDFVQPDFEKVDLSL